MFKSARLAKLEKRNERYRKCDDICRQTQMTNNMGKKIDKKMRDRGMKHDKSPKDMSEMQRKMAKAPIISKNSDV